MCPAFSNADVPSADGCGGAVEVSVIAGDPTLAMGGADPIVGTPVALAGEGTMRILTVGNPSADACGGTSLTLVADVPSADACGGATKLTLVADFPSADDCGGATELTEFDDKE